MTAATPITIWLIDMQLPPTSETLLATLPDSEQHQAQTRANPAQYLQRRAALRHLLGRHCQRDPRQLDIQRSAAGKPFLADQACSFSLSHSRNLWALAIAPDAIDIGVDIEVAPRPRDFLAIATRYFDPRETAHLHTASPAQQHAEFYARWTLKEAYLKALGTGIAGGLDRLCVSALAPTLVFECKDNAADRHWQLQHQSLAPDTHLALAYRAPSARPLILHQSSLAALF